MQEIAPNVYIESGFPGVTLAAINLPHGVVLIDSPFRVEDTRSWRSALTNLGGGVDRLLVNMDAQFDRTLGSRAMECTVVANEKVAQIFRNRPLTFKTQGSETGAEWEQYNGLGSIRWASPEITFTETMRINWEGAPVSLESHPGPAAGAIWAVLPEQKVVFLGDAVLKDQPPFLGGADLPAWIHTLKLLHEPAYQNYLLVSGRGGLVAQEEVRKQLDFLQKLHHKLETINAQDGTSDEAERLGPVLLKEFSIPTSRQSIYRQRLVWGLRQYYLRHYKPGSGDSLEE